MDQVNNIKIGTLNVRNGLNSRRMVALAKEQNYDIVTLTDVNSSRHRNIQNTIAFHHPEKYSTVIIIINTNIKATMISTTEHIVIVKLTDLNMNIVGYYCRPEYTNLDNITNTLNHLETQIKTLRGDTIFLGDLNGHHDSLGDQTDQRGQRFFDLINIEGYQLLNNDYTYQNDLGRTSSIDWCFTNMHNTEWSIDESFDKLSDHRMCQILLNNLHVRRSQLNYIISTRRFLRKITQISSIQNIHQWHEHLTQALQYAKTIKEAHERTNFWDTELEKERQELKNLLKLQRWQKYVATPEYIEQLNATIRVKTKIHKSNVAHKKQKHLIKELKSADANDFFKKYHKPSKLADRHYVDHLVVDGQTIHDPHIILNTIMDQFCGSQTPPDLAYLQYSSSQPRSPTFSDPEIQHVIRNFKLGKAPGEDRLMVELIKLWYNQDANYLHALFRYWFDNEIFPEQFKCSLIVPCVKNNSKPLTPQNLRPIGMLSHLSKMYEKLLSRRLISLAMRTNYFGIEQQGFLPARSTTSALIAIEKQRKKNRKANPVQNEIIASLDISRAFDSLKHEAIIRALIELKAPANIVEIMKKYFTSRTAKVTLGDHQVTRTMNQGIIQGGAISAFLWSLTFELALRKIRQHINRIKDAQILMSVYADDITLIVSSPGGYARPIVRLQQIYQTAVIALNDLGLTLSPEKTQLLLTHQNVTNMKIILGNTEVQFKPTIRVLGVHFSHDNSFTKHVKIKIQEARAKYAKTASFMRNKEGLRKRVRENIIQSIIYPTITYASAAWFNPKDQMIWNQIRSYFRQLAIIITRSYQTISHMSSMMLIRILPLHYYMWFLHLYHRKLNKGKNKHGIPFETKCDINNWDPPESTFQLAIEEYIKNQDQMQLVNETVHLFTDGSKLTAEQQENVGCALMVHKYGELIDQKKFKLPSYATVFQAELLAINQALQWIENNNHSSYAILSDSLSALQAITSPYPSRIAALDTRNKLINLLRNNINISLYWCKAHCDIDNNNKVDLLAKQASIDGTQTAVNIPISLIRRNILNKIKNKINNEYITSQWGRTFKQFVPNYNHPLRPKLIINAFTTLIYTGHLPTASYLHERKKRNSPLCQCGEVQTVKHILTTCTHFATENQYAASKFHMLPEWSSNNWDTITSAKHFTYFIAYRAKSIIAQLNEMNQEQPTAPQETTQEPTVQTPQINIIDEHIEPAEENLISNTFFDEDEDENEPPNKRSRVIQPERITHELDDSQQSSNPKRLRHD